MRLPAPKFDQINGGAGHTSKIARGLLLAASLLPAKIASISIISSTVLFVNAPVPIGISFYTFHAVSFLVDLSRAGGKEKSLRPFYDELAGGAVLTGPIPRL